MPAHKPVWARFTFCSARYADALRYFRESARA